ncbi:MAG: hypothetical protein AAGD07_22535 [Planctomycetota bacterium]
MNAAWDSRCQPVMNVFDLPTRDATPSEIRRWLLRRLQRTALLAIGLTVVTQTPWHRTDSQTIKANTFAPTRVAASGTSVAATPAGGITRRAVPPIGWRRTVDGWQHVSTWRANPMARIPLPQQILAQQSREPLWCRNLFAWLRSVPPLGFAATQLVIVFLIVNFQSRRSPLEAN